VEALTPLAPMPPPIEDPPGEMEPDDMDPVVWDLRRDRPPVEERDVKDVTEELSALISGILCTILPPEALVG
jgi:hypothetical protein